MTVSYYFQFQLLKERLGEMNVCLLVLALLAVHSAEALKCYTCFGESCRKSRGVPMECNNAVVEDFVKKLPINIPDGVIGNINFKDFECLKVDGVCMCLSLTCIL